MCSVTRSVVRFPACLSVRARRGQRQNNNNNVRWQNIVGNITVSNNDAVGGILPGTTPWSTTFGRASVNLATGRVSFDVDGSC